MKLHERISVLIHWFIHFTKRRSFEHSLVLLFNLKIRNGCKQQKANNSSYCANQFLLFIILNDDAAEGNESVVGGKQNNSLLLFLGDDFGEIDLRKMN